MANIHFASATHRAKCNDNSVMTLLDEQPVKARTSYLQMFSLVDDTSLE